MPEFSHSIQAAEILPKFYGKDITVFVEGKDDIHFWHPLFARTRKFRFHFEHVGGMPELEKRMRQISDDGASFIVACDRDYTGFGPLGFLNPRIVLTYGYSIENTMYSTHVIDIVIKKYSRSLDDAVPALQELVAEFETSCKQLLIYDIANRVYGKGIKVHAENCSRFLKGNRAIRIDQVKLERHILEIAPSFTMAEIDTITKLVDDDHRPVIAKIRGHFIVGVVRKWIEALVYSRTKIKVALSADSLYAQTVDICARCSPKCVHLKTHHSNIQRAIRSITEAGVVK